MAVPAKPEPKPKPKQLRGPRGPYVKTKLILGVGINDANHTVKIGSSHIKTYSTWMSMLVRCYSAKYQIDKPTYIGCSVCLEWLSFSVFEQWMLQQDHVGMELDKDLLLPGNKVYSPDFCVFVSRELNSLLNERAAARGILPIGVHETQHGKFAAYCHRGKGVSRYLGNHATPQLAHAAWQVARTLVLENVASSISDSRIKAALLLRAGRLRDDLANNRETISLNSSIP